MPVDVWNEELDLKIQQAVRGTVPARLYDDAVQEARLAVLEAEEGHTPSWYVSRGVWAAQKYARHERSGKIRPFSTEGGGAVLLDEATANRLDTEGREYPAGETA